QSLPHDNLYVFAYTITIRNTGQVTAQLISRTWSVNDAKGHTERIKGLGVVGHQPLLKPGGALLFVTCSLFPQEGRDLIADFVEQCREAEQLPLAGFSALLPSNHESLRHDGFYYASLRKRRN
ncbi:MAG: ApaG domain, partial [Betaproteobacteria bacterium]|nr:ApaG domain [Betaproteobacteria bacterium]